MIHWSRSINEDPASCGPALPGIYTACDKTVAQIATAWLCKSHDCLRPRAHQAACASLCLLLETAGMHDYRYCTGWLHLNKHTSHDPMAQHTAWLPVSENRECTP